jgi:choice-of-anchor B domain-containing protein
MRIIWLYIFLLISVHGISQNYNLELLGRLQYDVELSDIWGYADEEGNEYALVGLNNNFSIVDVTNPANPTEVFRTIGGSSSAWRDIKTWGDYAYVTCECGPGLLIVDMSPLPQSTSLTYSYWISDTTSLFNAHNLFIDENGIAYIFGGYSAGGAIVLDLNDDPMDPTTIGIYEDNYLHDGVVRGDTLWGAAVNNGEMQVIDVSDKAHPEKLATWKTPGSFSHNAWFSDDNKFIFTTDEVRNGQMAAYNVENIYNPEFLDSWKVNDTSIIPHNTHWHNDFLITSHYTYGVNIIDAKRPRNLLETAHYDTSPQYVYEGYNGCWGVYPFLPSGNIIASDIEEGLYIFKPTYVRGCYLEGQVTDKHTGSPLFFPTITILNGTEAIGNIVGEYAVSLLNPGSYTVVFSTNGYFPDTVKNVNLVSGDLTTLDVALSNWPLGVQLAQELKKVQIFPNPSRGMVSIKNIESFDQIQMFDLAGRSIFIHSIDSDPTLLDISGQNLSGVFFLKLTGIQQTQYHRIEILN